MRPMLCLVVWLAAGVAVAQDANRAIGRMNHADFRQRRHCTMFAVAPRTVVTAAHCIARLVPSGVRLLFGYTRTTYAVLAVPTSAQTLDGDVGVLCLGKDAPATLPLGRNAGAKTVAIGYGIPAQHTPQRTDCRVLADGGYQLFLTCELAQGASGAPILNAAGEVVAVASRSGPRGTLAAMLPEGIADRCPR